VFTGNITSPPVVYRSERETSDWAAHTTAAGRCYVDVRDSVMFDTQSVSDVRLFLSLVSGGLGLPLNVCLHGQEFLANNTDPDLAVHDVTGHQPAEHCSMWDVRFLNVMFTLS